MFAVVAVIAWSAADESAEPGVADTLSPPVAPVGSAAAAAPAALQDAVDSVLQDRTASATAEVQVCGGDWVRLDADGRIAQEEFDLLARRALESTSGATLAAMQGSADRRQQAAAHFFQSRTTRSADAEPAACRGDVECARLAAVQADDAHAHRDALARLASASSDAQVYAWAYRSCAARPSSPGPQGACQLIHAEQWARLDPSNAAPWVALAGQADPRRDAAALDDAMFHIASAERHDEGWGRLPAALIDAAPRGDAHVLGTMLLASQAVDMDAADRIAPAQTVISYCGADSLLNANRREMCQRVAELLVARSSTLLARNIGSSMGKRLGWPPERLALFDEERDAFGATALRLGASDSHEVLSCADVRRDVQRMRDSAQFGELAALRQAVESSGKPRAELAAAWRNNLRAAAEARAAEAAASAASVASTPYSAGPPPAR